MRLLNPIRQHLPSNLVQVAKLVTHSRIVMLAVKTRMLDSSSGNNNSSNSSGNSSNSNSSGNNNSSNSSGNNSNNNSSGSNSNSGSNNRDIILQSSVCSLWADCSQMESALA